MRREAHLIENDRFNGNWGDEFVYALLRREWLSRADHSGRLATIM